MANDDLFTNLNPLVWKGVTVPCGNFSLSLRHDIAHHKYPDTDGESLESTGRAALEHHATVYFRNTLNGLYAGISSSLYPQHFRNFLDVASKRDTGVLKHPELGDLKAKLQSAEVKWETEKRDGVEVAVVWLEHTPVDGDDRLAMALAMQSPVEAFKVNCADMDAAISALQEKSKSAKAEIQAALAEAKKISLEELARQMTVPFDSVAMAQRKVLGIASAILYRAQAIESAAEGAVMGTSVRPIIAQMSANLRMMANDTSRLQQGLRIIASYVLPADSTIAATAQFVSNSVGDIIKLNPSAAGSPTIPRGVAIRYYKAS